MIIVHKSIHKTNGYCLLYTQCINQCVLSGVSCVRAYTHPFANVTVDEIALHNEWKLRIQLNNIEIQWLKHIKFIAL